MELVKAMVHAAGPLQRLSATPESTENAEVKHNASTDAGHTQRVWEHTQSAPLRERSHGCWTMR